MEITPSFVTFFVVTVTTCLGASLQPGYKYAATTSTPAPYKYNYRVSSVDVNTNPVLYGKKEEKQGGITKGSYYVLLPDARLMTVNYVADDKGFHPTYTFQQTEDHGDFINPLTESANPLGSQPALNVPSEQSKAPIGELATLNTVVHNSFAPIGGQAVKSSLALHPIAPTASNVDFRQDMESVNRKQAVSSSSGHHYIATSEVHTNLSNSPQEFITTIDQQSSLSLPQPSISPIRGQSIFIKPEKKHIKNLGGQPIPSNPILHSLTPRRGKAVFIKSDEHIPHSGGQANIITPILQSVTPTRGQSVFIKPEIPFTRNSKTKGVQLNTLQKPTIPIDEQIFNNNINHKLLDFEGVKAGLGTPSFSVHPNDIHVRPQSRDISISHQLFPSAVGQSNLISPSFSPIQSTNGLNIHESLTKISKKGQVSGNNPLPLQLSSTSSKRAVVPAVQQLNFMRSKGLLPKTSSKDKKTSVIPEVHQLSSITIQGIISALKKQNMVQVKRKARFTNRQPVNNNQKN